MVVFRNPENKNIQTVLSNDPYNSMIGSEYTLIDFDPDPIWRSMLEWRYERIRVKANKGEL